MAEAVVDVVEAVVDVVEAGGVAADADAESVAGTSLVSGSSSKTDPGEALRVTRSSSGRTPLR
jgi:hypothetical protein